MLWAPPAAPLHVQPVELGRVEDPLCMAMLALGASTGSRLCLHGGPHSRAVLTKAEVCRQTSDYSNHLVTQLATSESLSSACTLLRFEYGLLPKIYARD